MKKRLLSLIVAAACLISCLSGVCFAAPAQNQGREEASAAGAETKASSGKKIIALTFDDGPGANTERLVSALRERGVHCTFFMVGSYVKRYSSVVRQCYEDGNQIANHSYSHPTLTSLSDSEVRQEIQKTNNALNSAIGCTNTYYVRPPYGDYNSRVLSLLGAPAIYWSDDSGDWRTQNETVIYNNVISGAQDGDILLLHDSHSWSVNVAIRVVDTLLARGFEFVTLSELFRRRGITPTAGNIYSSCRDNGFTYAGISKPTMQTRATPDGVEVTLSADKGTKIYYTTNGTVPNSASKVYTGPFTVKSTTTINAVAGYDMNGSRSNRLTQKITVQRCDAPALEIDAAGLVTLSAKDTVYYTTDGSEPTADSAVYTAPFTVEPGTPVRAMAYTAGGTKCASKSVYALYSKNGNVFDDVKLSDWFYPYIDYAASEKLLLGTGGYHYSPGESVTRAMLVTVLYRMCGEPETAASSAFTDVAADSWYAAPVAWAEQNGIVLGNGDGTYAPNANVTREQTATILYRFADFRGYEHLSGGSLAAFTDGAKASNYAQPALCWAVATGLLSGNGDGTLSPRGTTTRAELAVLLQRYMQTEKTWEKKLTEEELLAMSAEVLEAIKAQDYTKLADWIHPEKGVTLTPFISVEPNNRTIQAGELVSLSEATETELVWGSWAGSGEDIVMTFDCYWQEFVWNCDYTAADEVNTDRIYETATAISNLAEAYPGCRFVDYYVDSQDVGSPMGWSSLTLVFQKQAGKWYLSGIVHGEWTP